MVYATYDKKNIIDNIGYSKKSLIPEGYNFIEVSDEDWNNAINKIKKVKNGKMIVIDKELSIEDYEYALKNYLIKIAKENDFDSIQAATQYIGINSPYEEHAQALLKWNSECWQKYHDFLKTFNNKNHITIDEFIQKFPTFKWNKPVYPKNN